ncbi:MAG: HoxN/HupN/NixA family nickel/cobalt transporter [Mycobacteriaceae bacterium]
MDYRECALSGIFQRIFYPKKGIFNTQIRLGFAYLNSEAREDAPELVRLAGTLVTVLVLHVLGFGLAIFALVAGSGTAITLGAAMTAYLSGLKHQADADHISSIDNATRKFIADGRKPTSVGLAFSLGHSTVVLVVATAVIVSSGFLNGLFAEGNSAAFALNIAGGIISGGFLLLIGSVNLVLLCRLLDRCSKSEDRAGRRGYANTFISKLMLRPLSRVKYPRHMYLIGFLFGLGFDTATLIGLLVLTAASAVSGVTALVLFALPLCFAAGMTLGDTINGIFMMKMYTKATLPASGAGRFNILVTMLSVTSALGIGLIIVVRTAQEAFDLKVPVVLWLAALNIEYVGFVLITLFFSIALSSVLLKKFYAS